MNDRFLIQRYCSDNWPQVQGDSPFLSTGPNFFGWAVKGSVDRHGEHRFIPSFQREIEEAYGGMGTEISRYFAAWALLKLGIVQALWAGHSPVTSDRRWGLSVDQLASEIPKSGKLGDDVLEYLSGLSDANHFRSYVSEDAIELTVLDVPPDA